MLPKDVVDIVAGALQTSRANAREIMREAINEAHPACSPDMKVSGGALKLALNVLRRAGKHEVADELEITAQAAPAAVARPVAVLKFERGTPGRENEMPRVVSCNWMPDGEYEVYLAAAAAPTTQPAQGDALDAAFEAVRKRLCKLPRYSFALDSRSNLRRCEDKSGNWIEFDAVHALFDPVAIDAARAAQEGK